MTERVGWQQAPETTARTRDSDGDRASTCAWLGSRTRLLRPCHDQRTSTTARANANARCCLQATERDRGSERADPAGLPAAARRCQTLVLLPLACSGRVGQAREETTASPASPGQVARGASAARSQSLLWRWPDEPSLGAVQQHPWLAAGWWLPGAAQTCKTAATAGCSGDCSGDCPPKHVGNANTMACETREADGRSLRRLASLHLCLPVA
jgi:hypothetical protein